MRPATKLKIAPKLETLTQAWLAAREAEHAANAERLAIEAQIVEALPVPGTEGTATRDVGTLRVSVRYSMTREAVQ